MDKPIKIYLSHNMFGKDDKDTINFRSYSAAKLEKIGCRCLWLYDLNDNKRDLLPDEIVGRCYGIPSVADYIVMLDIAAPGWGKIFEMKYAYDHNIPILSVWAKEGSINPWVSYYSKEIFASIEDVVEYLKITHELESKKNGR